MHLWLGGRLDTLPAARGSRLNVLGPRGGAKSTLVTLAYVLREALENREPYIWIVSDSRAQACGHLDNLKLELTGNAALAAEYTGAASRGPVWRSSLLRLPNGVQVEAFGTGQAIRGRRHGANRPTLIVCDDIQSDRHAESPTLRAHTRRWFHSALLKAGARRTNVVHLATALHRDALGLELHRTPGWTSRVYKSIVHWPQEMAQWEAWESLYADVKDPDAPARAAAFYEERKAALDRGSIVLWPEEEDLYALMKLRAEGGRPAFEREKQNSPIHPELCEWPEAYFGAWIWFDHWPQPLTGRTVALDPSKGSDDRRGDYSAFVLLGVDEAGSYYVEADLARRPTPQIVTEGVELLRRFRPDAFGVEANQFQELLGANFWDEFRRQGLQPIAAHAIDNRVNKRVRIRRLGPLLATRRLRFKADSPGTRLLVEQLKDFPIGDHDDGPDALEMAIRLADDVTRSEPFDDGLGDRLVSGE